MTVDLTGRRFGRGTVLALHPERRRYGEGSSHPTVFAVWLCHCDCGTERLVLGIRLRSGRSRSCGCLKREKTRERIKHGHARRGKRTRPYNCWQHMKGRCNNPNDQAYEYYGGRPDNPISVDEYYGSDYQNWY